MSYAWALWLLAPVFVTGVVAVRVWMQGLPERRPTARNAIRAHQRYLDVLGASAARNARKD